MVLQPPQTVSCALGSADGVVQSPGIPLLRLNGLCMFSTGTAPGSVHTGGPGLAGTSQKMGLSPSLPSPGGSGGLKARGTCHCLAHRERRRSTGEGVAMQRRGHTRCCFKAIFEKESEKGREERRDREGER